MDRHDLVLAILDSNRGTVGNRTSLQKLGYFISTRTALEGVGYKDYFYGPFSKAVAIALEDLSEALLRYEAVRSSPIETYSYTLTDDGREIVKEAREGCREVRRYRGDRVRLQGPLQPRAPPARMRRKVALHDGPMRGRCGFHPRRDRRGGPRLWLEP